MSNTSEAAPAVSHGLCWELCDGTLTVQAHGTPDAPAGQRVRITDRPTGASLSISREQWEALKAAVRSIL